MDKDTKGTLSELTVISYLISRGYVVSAPVGGKSRYDLIVDCGKCFTRVQVKTCWDDGKKLLFKQSRYSGGVKRQAHSYINEVDKIAAVTPDNRVMWFDIIDTVSDKGIRYESVESHMNFECT
jgi:hypothetical protein